MKLDKYKLVEETDDYYRLDSGDGKPFRVAKKGLESGTAERITQHFAYGGPVNEMVGDATMGTIFRPELYQQTIPPPPPPPQGEFVSAQLQGLMPPSSPVQPTGVSGAELGLGPGVSGPVSFDQLLPYAPPQATPEAPQFANVPSPDGRRVMRVPVGTLTPEQRVDAGIDPRVAMPQAAPQPTQAPMPEGSGGSGGFRIPSPPPGLFKAEQEVMEGLKAKGQAEKAQAIAEVALREKQEQDVAAFRQESERRMAPERARGEQIFQDVLNSKVDPGRFWATRTTGQKIGSGIAIILSGIGQGLAGGPNMALQVIDKIIDQDIDAQKANISKNQGLLSFHMQRTQNLEDSIKLSKADLYDGFAAQLQKASAQFAGQKSAAEALIAAGQYRSRAEMERLNATNSILDREIKIAALQNKGDGGKPELFVPGYGHGLDPGSTKEARRISGDYRATKSAIDALKMHRQKYGAESMDRGAVLAGKTLAKTLQLKLKKSEELGTLDKGSQEVLDELINGDPGKFGFYMRQLEALEQGIDGTFDSQMSQHMDPRTYRSRSAADLGSKYGARRVQ